MNIIIGLGNPGNRYKNTRHNIGFLFVDALQEAWDFPSFVTNTKFNAEISEGYRDAEKILLVKPLTFMNESGIAVRKILDFYKLQPSDIVVIQDELDLPIGKHKIATDSGSAGHNGIKSIIEHIGTQTFTRLRIGIANTTQDANCLIGAHDFVLQAFTEEEIRIIQEDLSLYQKLVEDFLSARLHHS